jgi:hypothetical protein
LLPLCVFPFKLAYLHADECIEGNGDDLVADEANATVSVARHRVVNSAEGKSAAQVHVLTIRCDCPQVALRVKVLKSELHAVVILCCIRANIFLDKCSQVDYAVFVDRQFVCFIRSVDLLFVLCDEALVGTFSDHNDTVSLVLASLDDGLIHAVLSVELEMDLGNDDDVDVTTGKCCGDRNEATVTAHHAHDANTILGSSCFDICRVNELN